MKLTAPIGTSQAFAAFLLLLGAIFISLSSLGFEHIGGFIPCALCYIQRHVHYAMLPASAITLFAINRASPALLVRLMFLALTGLLLYGAGVGVYQAGAEWEFWLGPNTCEGSINTAPAGGDLLAQMRATKLVSCTVAQKRILGLSFGGWNVVLSTTLVMIALFGAFASKNTITPLVHRLPILPGLIKKLAPKS